MFTWNKDKHKKALKEELFSLEWIREIRIGVAFFSNDGLLILKELISKYNLKKSQVSIYLSNDFSQNNPHILLQELSHLAQVKIFFEHTFHAKVYFIKGNTTKLIAGSSNFTSGGFLNNIEFNIVEHLDSNQTSEIEDFFKLCDFRSIDLSKKIIDYYEENNDILEELKFQQRSIQKKMKGFIHQSDIFDSDDYDISDFYFNFGDYETFFERNGKKGDSAIKEKRKTVQEKMLAIHEIIYPEIKKLDLHCHWDSKHITSLIKPLVYNNYDVRWLGIRYGKDKSEVDILNSNLGKKEKDEIRGFQKHACLQYSITSLGFEINLFLAVKHDAVDRMHIESKMNTLQPSIEREIAKLKGQNFVWIIQDESTGVYNEFDIDTENPAEFCSFLKTYDSDGYESYLSMFYSPDDPRIKEKSNICFEIKKYFKLLNPLFNAMVWRPKK